MKPHMFVVARPNKLMAVSCLKTYDFKTNDQMVLLVGWFWDMLVVFASLVVISNSAQTPCIPLPPHPVFIFFEQPANKNYNFASKLRKNAPF